jgi:hypothetical protein
MFVLAGESVSRQCLRAKRSRSVRAVHAALSSSGGTVAHWPFLLEVNDFEIGSSHRRRNEGRECASLGFAKMAGSHCAGRAGGAPVCPVRGNHGPCAGSSAGTGADGPGPETERPKTGASPSESSAAGARTGARAAAESDSSAVNNVGMAGNVSSRGQPPHRRPDREDRA